MAPEIQAGLEYNGEDVDAFSLGVLLFCIVMNSFPFGRARKSDTYYRKLMK